MERRSVHCRVQRSGVTAAKTCRRPKCPSPDDQGKKLWCMFATECHSSTRKQHILPFVTRRMDPEGIAPSEITQTKTDTQRHHLCVKSGKAKLTENRMGENFEKHSRMSLTINGFNSLLNRYSGCTSKQTQFYAAHRNISKITIKFENKRLPMACQEMEKSKCNYVLEDYMLNTVYRK